MCHVVHLLFLKLMELLKKLRLDAGTSLWVVNAPPDVAAVLHGIEVHTKAGKTKPVKQLMLFAEQSADLNKYLPQLAEYIGHDTLFWICYPKKTGRIQSDLIKMEPWDVVLQSGYRGQTSVSVNDDWTGMRFTNAPRKKPSQAGLPPEERKAEGIDFVNRTTILPPDAQAVLAQHKGLNEFFDAMAFSHKKEYIIAINEAKRPETRISRINKMAGMVLKLMQEKELKLKAKRSK